MVLEEIEWREGLVEVYNFEVEGLHSYFAGQVEVLVHNCKKSNARELKESLEEARDHVDFAHIEADVTVSPNGQIKAKGGHFATSPKLQMVQGTEQVALNQVVSAKVRLQGLDGTFHLKTNNGGFSTMTPKTWLPLRAQAEIGQGLAE